MGEAAQKAPEKEPEKKSAEKSPKVTGKHKSSESKSSGSTGHMELLPIELFQGKTEVEYRKLPEETTPTRSPSRKKHKLTAQERDNKREQEERELSEAIKDAKEQKKHK